MAQCKIENCPDCAVKAGERHLADCDVERCSVCGLQYVSCRCTGHDKAYGRWTGLYPGEAECYALGYITDGYMPDLNKLYSSGLYKALWVKPE